MLILGRRRSGLGCELRVFCIIWDGVFLMQ